MSDLVVYDQIKDPIAYMKEMGNAIAKSGLFGCERAEQGQVLAMACACERINPIEFARTYHIIQNRLSMRADASLAKYQAAGGVCEWIALGDDGKLAKAQWVYKNHDLSVQYTIEDADRAGLIKKGSAWEKDPGSMLRARLITKAIRIVAPEIIAGYYSPEELEQIETPPAKPKQVDVEELMEKTAAEFSEPTPPEDTAVIDSHVVESNGEPARMVTASQVDRIRKTAGAIGMNDEQRESALKKRNVTSIHDLTYEQADELLEKLLSVELGFKGGN